MSPPGRLNFPTMKTCPYPILFLAGLLALPLMSLAEAEDPYYRVEIIVFSHADGRSDARRQDTIEDFTELTNPVQRAAALGPRPGAEASDALDEERTERDRQAELDAVLDLIDTLADLESDELAPALPTWPEPYLALESLSPRMEAALSRLWDSAGHDVLAWRAWHQPLAPQTSGERVRVHDDVVVAAEWVEIMPTGIPALAKLADGGPGTLEPRFHYRLDGGIRLRQRQFLHLEAELHWRVPPVNRRPWLPGPEFIEDAAYEIHRLSQSRTVRPDRLEYFDSSWLGLLVLIEELEPLDGGERDESAHDADTTEDDS